MRVEQPDVADALERFLLEHDRMLGSAFLDASPLVNDALPSLAVDVVGNAYVVGMTPSADFPTVNAFQPTEAGAPGFDGFLVKIAPSVPAPPVANAGTDGTVPEGWQVTLDGAASFDPNIDPLTYRWEQIGGPAVTLSSVMAMRPTFTAPNVMPGGATLTFLLTVNDGTAGSAPDIVNITVTNINQAPVADAGPDQTVRAGSPVTLDGSGTFDADDDRPVLPVAPDSGPRGDAVGPRRAARGRSPPACRTTAGRKLAAIPDCATTRSVAD